MGDQNDFGALLVEEIDGGEGGSNSGVISDMTVLDGNVKIHAHQHPFAREVGDI